MSNEVAFKEVTEYVGWQRRTVVHLCKPVELWFRFPRNFDINHPEHKVFIYLPGDGRTPKEYARPDMRAQADLDQVILVGVRVERMPTRLKSSECPDKIDRYKFWRKPYGYQWNNVAQLNFEEIGENGEWSSPFDSQNYLSAHIENAFKVFRNEVRLNAEKFYYWGHSAGGQLLVRHILLGDIETSNVIKSACAANPFTYTFPTFDTSYGATFPYIFDTRAFTPEKLRKIYADLAVKGTEMDFLLTLGTADIAETYGRESLQGLSRYERGNNFFDFIESMQFLEDMPEFSEEIDFSSWNESFKWQKIIVPGVAHESGRMWQTCWNHFFNTSLVTPDPIIESYFVFPDIIIGGVLFILINLYELFRYCHRRQITRKRSIFDSEQIIIDSSYAKGPGRDILKSLKGNKRSLPGLLHFITTGSKPAILDSNSAGATFTYDTLHRSISKFRSVGLGLGVDFKPGVKVATLVPNGPELSALLLCLFQWCTAVPMDIMDSEDTIVNRIHDLEIEIIIIDQHAPSRFKTRLESLGLQILCIGKSRGKNPSSIFDLTSTADSSAVITQTTVAPNMADDVGLILQTSGTGGVRKSVPYTLQTLILGANCIIMGWELTRRDVCYNCMPLFHIGGISRNLLAVILSGGSVIASPGFDPILFWKNLDNRKVTWYYAGPVQHQAFLNEGIARQSKAASFKLRFIANAAGNLSKELNWNLRTFYGFRCAILPGYGMTECMPICSPPLNYSFSDRPTTSGRSTGPNIAILSELTNSFVRQETGLICVSGLPVFNGYLDDVHNNGAFFVMDGIQWFKTGDLGYLDDQDYLFVTGRKKEVINRGGEILSPVEIESVLVKHPKISECMVFAAKHETLQECAGILVKLQSPTEYVLLSELHEFAKRSLSNSKLPQILLLTLSDLPKTSTGKITRVKFADKLNLPPINNDMNFFTMNRLARVFTTHQYQKPDGTIEWSSVKSFLPSLEEVNHTITSHLAEYLATSPVSGKSRGKPDAQVLSNLGYVTYISGNSKQEVLDFIPFKSDNTDKDSTDWEMGSEATVPFTEHKHVPRIKGLTFNKVIENIQLVIFLNTSNADESIQTFMSSLPNSSSVLSPDRIITLNWGSESIEEDTISKTLLDNYRQSDIDSAPSFSRTVQTGDVELKLKSIWMDLLDLKKTSIIRPSSSFFDLGGNSFLIGRLASLITEEFNVDFGIMQVYELQQFSKMSEYIDLHKEELREIQSSLVSNASPEDKQHSTLLKPFLWIYHQFYFSIYTLLQLIPTSVFYPIRRMGLFMLFLFMFSFYYSKGETRAKPLIQALVVTKIISVFAFPFVGILLKWILIFRFRAGTYPIYGLYYLRWYVANQSLLICGMGFFGWWNFTRILYYNLLGARISFFANIHRNAIFGEYDLLSIDKYCDVAEGAAVRCFAVDPQSKFSLRPVKMMRYSGVCPKGILVPGSILASQEIIRPTMSSYEIGKSMSNLQVDEARDQCNVDSECYPGFLIFIGFIFPIYVGLIFVSYLPIIFLLINMVFDGKDEFGFLHQFSDSVIYFSQPKRIMYFLFAKALESTVTPIIYFTCVVIVKKLLVGKFRPGGRGREGNIVTNTRHYLMATLLPDETLGGMLGLLGKHYEAISVCFRLLGAKVGKRVYWPGSGFKIIEYDLLEVGDDVIFGSRSLIRVTSKCEAKKVVIKNLANVADRCAILPGAVINTKTVIGTGTIIASDIITKPNSIYLGDKILADTTFDAMNYSHSNLEEILKLEQGEHRSKSAEISTPFGRAFYMKTFERKYRVMNQSQFIWLSFIVAVLSTLVQSLPLVGSLLIGSHINGGYETYLVDFIQGEPTSSHYWICELFYLNILAFNVVLAGVLLFDIIITRMLIGRRKPGRFNWDESSYCQRWQVNLIFQDFRRRLGFAGYGALDFIRGTIVLNQYYRLMGSRIGKSCCLFPSGGRPMLTEPDLVTLGNNVTVDSAALVCHLNSRGEFTLNKLVIGDNCALRSNSRMLAGAWMETNSQLLEHTLLFQGDKTSSGTVYQGWPAVPHDTIEDL